MIVKLFKPQFAGIVERGEKLQTIRPTPKRLPKIGDEVSLRTWTGKPYRSKQRILGTGIIDGIHTVRIDSDLLVFDGRKIGSGMREKFAEADGFSGWPTMEEWFRAEHGLPFQGIAIFWKLSNPNNQ